MANDSGAVHRTLESKRRESLVRSLAREVAMDIFDLETILKNHSLSDDEYAEICEMPSFKIMLEDATREWNAVTSTEERVRYKMLVGLEESLHEMLAMMTDGREPMSARVEMFKALQRGSGMHERGEVGTADRVQISINLGADTPPIVIEHQPPPAPAHPDEQFLLEVGE